MVLSLMLAIPTGAVAAGTPANTTITNTASADYTTEDGTAMPTVISPAAVVTVSAAPGIDASPKTQTGAGVPGKVACFPLTLRNTGNIADTLDLSATSARGWSVSFFRDDNANGFRESGETTAVTNTGSLAVDAPYSVVAVVTIPAGASGAPDAVTLRATSRASGSVTTTASVSVALTTASHPLAPAWSCDLGSPVYSSPTVAGGVAYVGADDGHLYAIKTTGAGAGSLLWKYPAATAGVGGAIRDRPTYYNDVLYFGANNGCVYAVNPDGSQRWVRQISPDGTKIEGTPAVVGGTVYAASSEGYLYAVRATDGGVTGRSALLATPPTTSPAIPNGNFVWFGCQGGGVSCLSPDLGTFRWAKSLGTSAVLSSPSVDPVSGIMVVGSPDGSLYGMNSTTGSTAWGPVAIGGSVTSAAWVEHSDGFSYITAGDNKIYAFRTTTGAVADGYPFAPEGVGGLVSSPVVLAKVGGGARYLYAGGNDGRFVAIAVSLPTYYASYDLIGAGEPAGKFSSSPAASGLDVGDVVVIGCTNGKVYAFPLQ